MIEPNESQTPSEPAPAPRRVRPAADPGLLGRVHRLKIINDSRGHAAGDRSLLDVVNALRDTLRFSDVIMRYGGDEFVCILPGATIAGAEKRLTHVNTSLAQPSQPSQHGSVTIGLAELRPTDSPADLVSRADAELYRERQNRFPVMRQPPDEVSRQGPASRRRFTSLDAQPVQFDGLGCSVAGGPTEAADETTST